MHFIYKWLKKCRFLTSLQKTRLSFSLNFSCVCVPSLSWQILELSQYKMARNKDVFCTVEEWADDRGGHVLLKNAYIYIFV